MRLSSALVVLLCSLSILAHAAAPPQIVVGHRLEGRAAEAFSRLAERFNAVEKSGSVSLVRLDGAGGDREAPNLLLVDDDDGRYLDGRRIEPLHRLLAANGVQLDARRFYPALRDAVDDAEGRLQALPLALALPVLYWNKDAFHRVGLDPAQPPRTWWALQEVAGKLFDGGVGCPYASSSPVWVHLENTSTLHNEPFVSGGRSASKLAFNNLVNVKHIALLSSWFKSRYFHLFGSVGEADAKFAAGECAVLTSGSNLYRSLGGRVGFEFGVAELPYYDDVYGARPGQVVPAGAALWAVAGRPRAENRIAARFVAFLMEPAVQQDWVLTTGYLPMMASAGVGEIAGLGRRAAQVLGQQLSERREVAALRAGEPGAYDRMRAILSEELNAVWADTKPPKEALDTAVRRGNAVLNNGSKPAGPSR